MVISTTASIGLNRKMFNIFKKDETEKENNHPSIIAVACLLIHSARIDENYTNKEKKTAIIPIYGNLFHIKKQITKEEPIKQNKGAFHKFTTNSLAFISPAASLWPWFKSTVN